MNDVPLLRNATAAARDTRAVDETATTTAGAAPTGRRRRRLAVVLIVLVGLVALAWFGVSYVDRSGLLFFETGKEVLGVLDPVAEALLAGDIDAVGGHYSADFSGRTLGLNSLTATYARDGIEIFAFGGGDPAGDRGQALDEWRRYVEGFDQIEEVGLYIHRLEEWRGGSDIIANVRFELIGTPRGATLPGIDRAYFRMAFTREGEALRISRAEPIEGDRVISGKQQFTEVGAAAGIDFENRYYPEFLNRPLKFGMLRYGPAGITAVDYDNDGFHDLFVPDGVESRLFRNTGDGRFLDVTTAAGLSGLDGVAVGVFGDYDNDGHKDLFVSRTFLPNQLFRNNGDGTFQDVTPTAGINADCCTTVAAWADYNNDGFLDLYVGRYLDPRESIPTTFYARNGLPNQLYRNDGDGTFTNVTEEAGVGEIGLCLGAAFGDVDNDGWADLYVSNDFGRKTLYHNNGDGTFDDVTVQTGTLAYGAGMSSTIGDYDNDGNLDLYVAHIRSEEGWYAEWPTVMRYMINSWRQGVWMTDMPLYMQILRQSGFDFIQVFQDMASGNTLLRNLGDGTFEDVTWQTGANPPGWFWGTNMVDFDNDGWQDIYAANGWVYNDKGTEIELEFLNNVVTKQDEYKTGSFFDPSNFGSNSWHGWERNRHLLNMGDGTFKETGRAMNTDLILNSRGTAVADFWNRGVMDVAVAASTGRHALLRNDHGLHRNWLAVELTGAAGELPDGTNRDAVGVRVRIRAGGQEQMREVVLGDGYSSQSALRLHFGVGDLETVDELIVRWPRSGREQRFADIAVNRIVAVKEGRETLEEPPYGSHAFVAAGPAPGPGDTEAPAR